MKTGSQQKTQWLVYAIGFALLSFVVFVYSNKSHSAMKEEGVQTAKRPEPTQEELIDQIYRGDISATQMEKDVERLLGFSKESGSSADKERHHPTDEEVSLMTAYLDGLVLQRKKLKAVATSLNGELGYIDDLAEEPIEKEDVRIKGFDSPALNGLLAELEQTPLHLRGGDKYTIWVDYDAVKEKYGEYLTDFHQDLMTYHKEIMRFGYHREDGRLDAELLYNLMRVIDGIQDGDRTLDDFYWEEERYNLATFYTGYGKETLPDWDDQRINQLEAIVKDNSGENYADMTERLLNAMDEDSGQYGHQTVRTVNEWMHNEFKEYRKYLEEIKK